MVEYVVFLDIDNCLYSASAAISQLMMKKIRRQFTLHVFMLWSASVTNDLRQNILFQWDFLRKKLKIYTLISAFLASCPQKRAHLKVG